MTKEKAIEYVNAQLDKAVDDADAMDDEMYEALQTLVKIAEQNPRWIPVSERLPKEPTDEWYWSSYHGKDIAADEYIVMIKGAETPTSLHWTGDVWMDVYALDGCKIIYEVVAWMPLPKPYKAESGE